jgi:hypothetical protein
VQAGHLEAANSVPKKRPDLFETIVAEIDERVAHWREMEALGEGGKVRNRIIGELAQRMRELEKVDKVRAAQLRDELGVPAE